MMTPLASGDWNYQTAAHLLNRAAFGGTPEEIERTRQEGIEAAVASLLHPPEEPLETEAEPFSAPLDVVARRRAMVRAQSPEERRAMGREMRHEQFDALRALRAWWLERIAKTRGPLAEKMTLFWHGHFATSAQKVTNGYWMWQQNETFRRNALGNFKTLLKEISRDPAMMVYLDLQLSKKEHPNENWAREVMELFTLGIGHYSEDDIRESARAFTGYRIEPRSQEFRFVEREHDETPKTFMARTGNFSGDDILEIIAAQPACPKFIGRKLWRFFVEDEPPAQAISAVADSLRRHDFELRPVLREIFSSAEFYDPRVIRIQIKSPVQFLVQSCRVLETGLPPAVIAQNALHTMGQMLLAPPNVKGWDGGKSWISTATLLFRYNFAGYLVNGTADRPNAPDLVRRDPIDVAKIAPPELRDKPQELVEKLGQRLFQTKPGAKQTETFLGYLASRAPDRSDETIRHLLHLMMSTPQYQLT